MMLGTFQKTFFPTGNFPSGNFPNVQFPKLQLSKSVLAAAVGLLACYSHSARPPRLSLPQRSAALEIARLVLGNCYLGSRPWENVSGKIPNTENIITDKTKKCYMCPPPPLLCGIFIK